MDETIDRTDELDAGAASAPEGTAQAATADEVSSMYKELGIKAPAPTGATKGRPKTASVRAKSATKDGATDSSTGPKRNDAKQDESKDAPASDDNGDSGDKADTKVTKDSKDAGRVQDESVETGDGVRDTESRAKEDAKRSDEDDAEQRDDPTGQEAHESDDTSEEDEGDDEGKRPGKSNPKIEQRIQRLTEERRAAEERAAALEQQLQEKEQAAQQAKIQQEDPEYTIDDFRKVRDEEGNVIDLDPERAELAWRRWKDGYDARADQRNAEANRQAELERAQAEYSEKIMRQSVEAYDTLAGLMDEYPELVSTSGKFDQSFASRAMPVIQEAIQYQEGTEPGNPEGNQPIIAGLKLNPKVILDALRGIQAEKRALPLNGLNDNVEVRSNVNVRSSRSSDPTVNAANELYKELNINKRI